MRKALKSTELVSWHENPSSGHVKGLITQHVKQPFYIDVDPSGAWVLHTLDKKDAPVFVDKGQAKNVVRAKQAATASALSNIPEIKQAVAHSEGEILEPKVKVLAPTQVSTERATLRWYGKVSALILWGIFLGYWWIRWQPRAATLSILTLAFGLLCAYQVRRALTHEGDKLDKISRRKQLQQAKAIAQQQAPQPQVRQLRQVQQPTRKALRP
ncbi:MAG: hypothetical protein AAF708_00425 [Deinococcota bacterium]